MFWKVTNEKEQKMKILGVSNPYTLVFTLYSVAGESRKKKEKGNRRPKYLLPIKKMKTFPESSGFGKKPFYIEVFCSKCFFQSALD